MSRNNSGSLTAGGARVGGGTDRISAYPAPDGNHNGRRNVEMAERIAERARLIRAAMIYTAKQLLVAIPPSDRTAAESQKLQDMARDRSAVTDENMAFLMALQDRVEGHHLSDNLRGVEVRGRADLAQECIHDLSESEQAVDAEADAIQLKLAREKSATRLQQITEIGPRIIAAWRRLVDRAHFELARTA